MVHLWLNGTFEYSYYRGTDNSLARPGRKEAIVSVRMAWISFGALPCKEKKKLDDSSRLDVVEIARVTDMIPSLFLPGLAKDLSALRVIYVVWMSLQKTTLGRLTQERGEIINA